jgi:hypothetical protein
MACQLKRLRETFRGTEPKAVTRSTGTGTTWVSSKFNLFEVVAWRLHRLKSNYEKANHACLMDLIQYGRVPLETKAGQPKAIRSPPGAAQVLWKCLSKVARKWSTILESRTG